MESQGTARVLRIARLALGALLVVSLVLFGRRLGAYLPAFTSWVEGLGPWGPIAFIAGYALACVLLVPGSVLTLAAGAIFGFAPGVAFSFIGASLGATLAFLVSRHVVRGAVTKRLVGNAKFEAIDAAITRDGRRIVFLLRLSPLFPFTLLNYGLGLTRVKLLDYMLACAGMLPACLLYVYYGMLAGEATRVAAGASPPKGAAYYVLLVLGLAATIAVTVLITRAARKALRDATGHE